MYRKAASHRHRKGLALLVALIVSAAVTVHATEAKDSSAVFTDVAFDAGIQWEHVKELDYFAVGQVWGDYDNDGWLDIYVTSTLSENRLYRNNQDGTFSLSPSNADVSLTASISGGAIFADYDNDGDQDLYVLNRGANVLLRNDGSAGFTDVTDFASVGDDGKGSAGVWGDYDQDGHLDLYVVNWMDTECAEGEDWDCPANSDHLYHNEGDGTFIDVTDSLGLVGLRGSGFAASFVDYDNDGDSDIYLVNDIYKNPRPIGNQLWRNDGPAANCDDPSWCWTNVSISAGAGSRVCGMGLAVGDYDNDGDLDFYFSNAFPASCEPDGDSGIHHLLQNQTSQGSPTFVDVTVAAGVDNDRIGWGTVFVDCDNDGWLDLYSVASGPEGGAVNHLSRNTGNGRFSDFAAASGVDDLNSTLGVAYADYDQDGWLDLLTSNYGYPSDQAHRLFHNNGASNFPDNHWLSVQLTGRGPVNKSAVGGRVYLYRTDGVVLMQEVKNGSNMGSGNQLALHFGLAQAEVQKLVVVWPDGKVNELDDVQRDQRLSISYPPTTSPITPPTYTQ